MYLSFTCLDSRTNSFYEVIDIVKVDGNEISNVGRGKVGVAEQNPNGPPEQDVVHDEEWHLRDKRLNRVPSYKESSFARHQIEDACSS